METINLDNHVFKILTQDEKHMIHDFMVTNGGYKILYDDLKFTFVLCKPQTIEENLINNNYRDILFLTIINGTSYFVNFIAYFTKNYNQPNVKDILLKNYDAAVFDILGNGYGGKYNCVRNFILINQCKNIISEKIIVYLHEIFTLLKEIDIVYDVKKYIFMILIENIFR